MPQTLLPDGTISSGNWSAVGAATIHEAIDEGVDAHDGDTTYADSGAFVPSAFQVSFANVVDNDFFVGLVIRVTARWTTGSASVTVEAFINNQSLGSKNETFGSTYETIEFFYDGEWSDIDMNTLKVKITGGALGIATRVTAMEAFISEPYSSGDGGTIPTGLI